MIIASFRHSAGGFGKGYQAPPSAADVLGAGHPLTRALDLRGVLQRQSSATGLVVVASALTVLLGAYWARAPLIAALAVQLVLAACLAAVAALERERACDLIIEGRDVRLPVIVRERQRLLERRRRRALAHALEALVRDAERSQLSLSRSRPVYEAFVVRQVGPELIGIAAYLRSATVDVRGVARCERLLTIGTSPLFGAEIEELRAELTRIRTDLGRRGLPADDGMKQPLSMNLGR